MSHLNKNHKAHLYDDYILTCSNLLTTQCPIEQKDCHKHQRKLSLPNQNFVHKNRTNNKNNRNSNLKSSVHFFSILKTLPNESSKSPISKYDYDNIRTHRKTSLSHRKHNEKINKATSKKQKIKETDRHIIKNKQKQHNKQLDEIYKKCQYLLNKYERKTLRLAKQNQKLKKENLALKKFMF